MMDQNRQVDALRDQLDRELAAVNATAAARERLVGRLATPSPVRRRLGVGGMLAPRGLRSTLVVPLAAAAVVAIAVAVPTVMRAGSTSQQQPAGVPQPPPAIPVPTPYQTPYLAPSPQPSVPPKATSTPRAARTTARGQSRKLPGRTIAPTPALTGTAVPSAASALPSAITSAPRPLR
jgi:hypothetical protein